MRRLLKAICVFLSLAFAFTAVTFCWFSQDELVNLRDDFGSAKASYFKSGNGSKSDKYVIASATHFYNFAWLQYLGYFNHGKNGHNGRYQSYFEVDASLTELDFEILNSALPPIGTAEYPFIGNFEGNGVVVKNYTVSNEESALTKRPSAANFKGGVLALRGDGTQEVSTVGLFGITGDKDGVVLNDYGIYSETNQTGRFKDTANSQTAVPDAGVDKDEAYYSAMSVSNFYADDLSVKSVSANTLVGLAAGYANAAIENVGVYRCGITVNANATGLNGSDFVSKYSLLGDYNEEAVSWVEKPGAGGEAGDDNAWGGSIDMKSFWDRITSFMSPANATYTWTNDNKTYYHRYNAEEGAVSVRGSSNFLYLCNAVNKEEDMPYNGGTVKVNPTHLPLKTTENGNSVDKEKNTGYIGASMKNDNVRIGQKTWGSNFAKDHKVYTKTAKASGSFQLVKEYVGYDADGNAKTNTISDASAKSVAELGLQNYLYTRDETLKGALVNLQAAYETSQNAVYGLHFMNTPVVASEYYTVPHAYILGNDYVDYQMPQNSIDCHLKKRGYISFFAITNYSQTLRQNFFSIHEIKRNGNNELESVNEISYIYEHKTDKTKPFVYEYSNNSYSDENYSAADYEMVFDTTWLTNSDTDFNTVYYFEVPVNGGEYAIGAGDSSSTGAYLVYLDLQANGSDDGSGNTPDKKPYNITTLDFVNDTSDKNFSKAYADVTAEIKKAGTANSSITFERLKGNTTNEKDEINTAVYYVLTNFNVSDVVSDVVFTPDSLFTDTKSEA